MKVLSKVILIGACCLAASVQARTIVGNGGGGGGRGQPPQGTTQATIDSGFYAYIVYDINSAASTNTLNSTVRGLLDRDLVLLASLLIRSGGSLTAIHQTAATQLDGPNLVRWQAAFSQAAVSPAVAAYSPAAVASYYFNHPALRKVVHGGGMPVPGLPSGPSFEQALDMTAKQIYLEFRLAGLTPASAIYMTFTRLVPLSGAWSLGYYGIGPVIYGALTSIDPSYGYDIVTTYGSSTDAFGIPVSFSSTGSGFAQNPDGTFTDPNTGEILSALPGTNYGIPTSFYIPWNPNPAQDLYNFYDIPGDGGECLVGLLCIH